MQHFNHFPANYPVAAALYIHKHTCACMHACMHSLPICHKLLADPSQYPSLNMLGSLALPINPCCMI